MPEDVWLQSLQSTTPGAAATIATEQAAAAAATAAATATTSSSSTPTSTPPPAPAPTTAAPSTFTMSGFTYSQPSVARMMRRLDIVPWLSGVSLVSSTKAAIGADTVFQFTIKATVVAPRRPHELTGRRHLPGQARPDPRPPPPPPPGAATWFTLIGPEQSKAHSLETSIKTEKTQLAQLTHNEPSARKHAVSQSLLLGRALPSVTGMPQIVLQLSRIATEEHVSLDSITPQTAVSYSGYQALPITVMVSGNFLNVQGFLGQLRNQVRVTDGTVAATGRLYDVLGVTFQAAIPPPKVTATLTIDASPTREPRSRRPGPLPAQRPPSRPTDGSRS